MAQGNYVEAAATFEDLARAAEMRGRRRAPIMLIQAGRAQAYAGKPAEALDLMKRGLAAIALAGETMRLNALAGTLAGELEERGYGSESQQLSAYARSLLPGAPQTNLAAPPPRRSSLPSHCPGCGAPLKSAEVDWIDEETAECAFCGTPVKGE
jgi:hypothetical protein